MSKQPPAPINREYFKHMSFSAALDLAIGRSGMTREDVAELMKWSPSNASRYFNPSDNYWPQPQAIPRLCAVLRNRDLIDWLLTHYDEERKGCGLVAEPMDELALLRLINEICKEMGDVHRAVEDALKVDHSVQPHEARTIIRQSYDVLVRFGELIAGMSALREDGGSAR
ncbi:helix-turn-helix domain-containing protein [Desulfovibrio mangrovi]|uniref:helix-turn-helix domain-containing protein n=1 Tax=Desulfovibrio mangrovi TaxID=2976983 RepID=UPI0022481F8E|nr:helix-turn-helix transcriptional regulator [Desulfovibrio mangrovi]UZP67694.1 helix-turn-helix domain-containing protein [Desulfovibrio mangrovi]